MEKEKMSMEDKVKVIDDLIEARKDLYDKYMKAIDKLGEEVPSCILSDLTHEAAYFLNEDLKRIKKQILEQSLGDEYADLAFGVAESPIY